MSTQRPITVNRRAGERIVISFADTLEEIAVFEIIDASEKRNGVTVRVTTAEGLRGDREEVHTRLVNDRSTR